MASPNHVGPGAPGQVSPSAVRRLCAFRFLRPLLVPVTMLSLVMAVSMAGGRSSSAATAAGGLTVQPGSLNDLSVVFSATISGHESCHINEGPHGFDSCNLQTSLEGGREDFNAQWSMNVSAVVPVTSSDDLAHPGAGTGSGRETSVAISSKGTIVDGHNALDGCSYVSPSATEVQATASPAPTPAQVTDLHALRSGSTVKDFSLTLLPGGQDSVDTTVDFDKNDCWPGGPFSETLISEFAGDSFIGAADPVAHDDHGNPVYTGWRLDPDGTWQKDRTGPIAEKTVDTTFDENLAPGDHASGTLHEHLTLETPCAALPEPTPGLAAAADKPNACSEPKAIIAAGAPLPRGSTLHFDGSHSKPSSKAKITSYHWTADRGPDCPSAVDIQWSSDKPSGAFTVLCGIQLHLTVTDSAHKQATTSKTITVTARKGEFSQTPFTDTPDPDGDDTQGLPPADTTATLIVAGRNVSACDDRPDLDAVLCPQAQSGTWKDTAAYALAVVQDHGPFAGDWYVLHTTLKVALRGISNVSFGPNGDPPSGAHENVYSYNTAHNAAEYRAWQQQVAWHENEAPNPQAGHGSAIKQALNHGFEINNIRPYLEKQVDSSKAALTQIVEESIETSEQNLRASSDDRRLVPFSSRNLFLYQVGKNGKDPAWRLFNCPSNDIDPCHEVAPSGQAPKQGDAGQKIHIDAGTFTPSEPVHIMLHSQPLQLTTLSANSAGQVHADVIIPACTTLGQHTITLTGATSATTLNIPITVVAGSHTCTTTAHTSDVTPTGPAVTKVDNTTPLAHTGITVLPQVLLGLISILGGVIFVEICRRHRPTD